MNNIKNDNIKIIRAVSCAMILLTHFGSTILPLPFLSTFFTYCAEGVRAFFILSGYLMCFSKELHDGQVIAYYKKRIRRILPVYLFIVIILFALGIINIISWPYDETGLYWLRYFLFLSTSVPSKEVYWTNLAMTWTVSYFIFFYLIAPVIHKVISSFRNAWIAVILSMSYSKILPDGWLEPMKGLYAFLLGIAIYYAIRENKEYINIIICSAIAFLFYIHGIAYPYGDTFLISIVILSMLKTNVSFKHIMMATIIDFIDKHSYSIYLMQGLVITVVTACLGEMKMILGWILLIGTIVIAYLFDLISDSISYRKYLYEKSDNK